MAGEPLIEELSLDISPALDALEPLGAAFDDIVTGFSTSLATALSSAVGAPIDTADIVDSASITTAIDTAVGDAAPDPVPVDGDTAALDASITSATDVTPSVAVDGDTGALTSAIDDAAAAPATVSVDADTTTAQAGISDLQATPVVVPVEADTTDAVSSVNDLGAAVDNAIGSSGGDAGAGGSGLAGFESLAQGVGAATGLASGETEGLTGTVTKLAPGLEGVVGAGVGFTAFLASTINLAADAQAKNKLFIATFGDMATAVQQVNVGGLDLSFQQIGKDSGTSVVNLEAAATRIGLLGQSAGATNPQIKTTTDNIVAMAAAFSVSNPSLGDAAQVTEGLTSALARGGRALSIYGLSISAREIQLRAMSDTGKTAAADLTQYDKVQAASEIATAQLGNTLGTKFADGAKNASVQLRALKNDVEESLATIGTPLLGPAISSLQAFIPVVTEVGSVLGEVAQIILPFAAALAPAVGALAAPLGFLSTGLDAIAGAVSHLNGPELVGLAVGFTVLAAQVFDASAAFAVFGAAFDIATGPIGLTVAAISALGVAVDVFGGKSSGEAKAAKEFGDALFGAGSGASNLDGQLAALSSNIDKLSTSFVNAKKPGSDLRTILDTAGGGVSGLSTALQGSDAQFKTYIANIAGAGKAVGEGTSKTTDTLVQQLKDQRQALQDTETQQIATLGSTNQVSAAQVAAAEATVKAKDGYLNLADVLKILNDDATVSSSKLLQTSVDTGKLADAVNSFNPKTDSLATFEANLGTLGVSTTDATTLGKDLQAATDQQADAFKLASPAAQALAEQLGAGTITGADFEKQLFSMGVTLPDIKTELQAVQSGVESFVRSAANLAPSIDTALTDVEKNQSSAQSAQQAAAKAIGTTADTTSAAVDAAFKKIAVAEETGGKSQAAAITSAKAGYATAVADAKTKTDTAAADLQKTNLLLTASADPKNLIAALQKGLKDTADFEANLSKIVADGGTELAQHLAAQGPEVAGAQAAALAIDPKGVKLTEGLIGQADSAKQKLMDYYTTTFGPQLGLQLELQAGIVGKDFNPGPSMVAGVTTSLAATEAAIRGAAPTLGSASAFSSNRATFDFANGVDFHTVTETSIAKAQDKIRAGASGLGAAATDTGTSTTGAYGGALGVDKATTTAFQAGVTSIQNTQAALIQSSSVVGQQVGASFDQGIVGGIQNGTPSINAAAFQAASAAKAGANAVIRPGSPSRLGIEIGQNFVEGLVVGISDVAPIVAVSGVLAEDMATSFSAVGVAALGGLIQGLNDPATIDAASKALSAQLAAAIAAAQTTAQTAAPTAAAQSISSFVSAAVGQLPTASAAISKFSQNAASDLTTAQNATKALQTAQAKLATDTAQGANTAQNTAAEANAAQAKAFSTQATLNLHAAENDLARDRATKASKGTISADELLIVQVRDASTAAALKLADADKFLAAVRKTDASSTTLASDAKTVAADKANLTNAQNQLDAATNPDTFTKNLNNSTNAARVFQSEIAKLVAEGDKGLAEKLATAGPDVAGKLADSFAASSVKAKAAESAIDAASAFSDSYQQFLEKQFAPAVTAQATAIGAAVGTAISAAATSTLTPLHPAALATPTLTPGQLTSPIPVAPVNLTSAPINIDLTINHSDGTITKVPIVIPASPPSKLIQKVVAEVSAG